jgi:hypothetical protein
MIVIAVESFDVHARIGHHSGELSQLARNGLLQPLNDDISNGDNTNAGVLECGAGSFTILEQEVSGPPPVHYPRTTTFDTHPRAAERFTQLGKCAGPILEIDLDVLQSRHSDPS